MFFMIAQTATAKPAKVAQTYKKAERLGRGLGVLYVEYDPELFNLARVESILGEKHVFPTWERGERTVHLRGKIPFIPYAGAKDLFARNGEQKIPVEIFIYNDRGVGFVEISTTEEFAGHPKYRSVVDKLCDGRAAARLDNYAISVLKPSRLERR